MNDLQILIVSIFVGFFGYIILKRLSKHAASFRASIAKPKKPSADQVSVACNLV